jgi:hypothetical protein
MKSLLTLIASLLCLAVVGCGEKPQTAGTRRADTAAFEGPATAFTAPGWKPGDASSWGDELRTRAQGQNEYVRIGSHSNATH